MATIPVSAVAICSRALMALGARPINSFTENLDQARLAASLYPSARRDLIRQHTWNCCIKRILLAPDVEKPAFGYQYSFTLPADYIRLLSIGEVGEYIDYQVESRKILTNHKSLKLRYVFSNEDEATYDDSLINLLELQMAAKMAYAITQSTSLAQFKLQEFELALRTAKALDGLENPADTLGESPLLEDRLHG